MSIIFLTIEEVLAIHRDQITRYGGSEGLRDLGLLKSAIAVPCATFEGNYLHGDPAEMAAAYMFHLIGNHPFIDGNKRVGIVAAIIFLDINGLFFDADESELEELVFRTARSESTKAEIADFFRNHISR